jgi:ribosomal subunit interface protein
MINHNIKGTGLEVTPELRSYVEKKLEHIEKLLQGEATAHADIELQFTAGEQGKKFRAEYTLSCKGQVYRVEERGDTMHEAIDIAIGELARELAKEKKKKMHVFRRSAAKVKDYIRGFRRGV